MNQMPSESTFWSWAIRGLGGSVNILEGLVGFGPRLSLAQQTELSEVAKRLYVIVDQAKSRIHELGAEFHEQQPEAGSERTSDGNKPSHALASPSPSNVDSSHPGCY